MSETSYTDTQSLSVAHAYLFKAPAPAEISTLSLHDALPIWVRLRKPGVQRDHPGLRAETEERSEEHTSELQSPYDLVCRLLLEKKKYLTSYSKMGVIEHSVFSGSI